MPDFMINGIPVSFPYEPYGVQTVYMGKVIECLKLGVNGILESPTGTGKTLSLLCASLSWLSLKKAQLQAEAQGTFQISNGDFVNGLQESLRQAAGPANSAMAGNSSWGFGPPQIIYASRTHTQLTQAVQELKKAGYGHMKVAVLGSRDQMCIHPEVAKAEGNFVKIHMCQALTKSGTCYFNTNLERKKGDPALLNPGVLDIEDLVKVGQKHRVCPYFLSRELRKEADIVFMPYNYILDHKRLRAQGVKLENSIIILDEAHNIEKICEESASVQIRSTDVAVCIQEITQVMKKLYDENESAPDFSAAGDSSEPDFTADELCILKTIFLELEKAIDETPILLDDAYPGSYIIELLAKAQITHERSTLLIDVLERIVQYLSVSSRSPFQFKGVALQKVIELLNIVFRTSRENNFLVHKDCLKRSFKVHVTEEEPTRNNSSSDSWAQRRTLTSKVKGKVVNYMCFTPEFGMKQLLASNVRCVILTSGTLSPLPPLVSEFNIPFPVTLENPHVIGPGQVYVSIVSKGPDGFPLNSSFSTRNDPRYIASLGNTILNVCRVIPHGVLIFFPSYPLMYKCKEEWQLTGLWSKISDMKPIFVESKNRETFASTIKEYYNKIQDPTTKGACFIAVTRGKVSEGLDFMDVNGRAVIVTGLPYPPMMDAYVKLKKRYLQENNGKRDGTCLTSEQWYLFEASRAVNQAIGRVIRHKNDYGAILLCDSRFDANHFKNALSSWVRPHIKKHEKFGPLISDLKKFFVNAEKTLPPPRVKGPATEIKLPTAVAASFDFLPSRSSTSTKSEPVSKAPTTHAESTTDVYLENMYKPRTSKVFSEGKKTDLFVALEKPMTVIDFNDISAASSSRSTFKWNDDKVQEPKAKKLKLRVAPPRISSQESVDMFTTDDDALSAPTVLRPTMSRRNVLQSSAKSVEKQNDDKANDSKTKIYLYLKEVKKSLDKTSYNKFSQMTRAYRDTKDFTALKESLSEIMLGDGRNFKHLFRGYRTFVQSHHREEFDKLSVEMLPE